jgi:hypothetical protein
VTGLRNVAAGRGILIPASSLGKGKMALQVTAIFLLLFGRRYPGLQPLALAVLWLVVLVALVSGVDYFMRYRRQAARADRRSEPASGDAGDGDTRAYEERPGALAAPRAAGASLGRSRD